jgi:hypothetical protein
MLVDRDFEGSIDYYDTSLKKYQTRDNYEYFKQENTEIAKYQDGHLVVLENEK